MGTEKLPLAYAMQESVQVAPQVRSKAIAEDLSYSADSTELSCEKALLVRKMFW
jgi:hypothetical protein